MKGKAIIEGKKKGKYRRERQEEKARWDAARYMKGNPYKGVSWIYHGPKWLFLEIAAAVNTVSK